MDDRIVLDDFDKLCWPWLVGVDDSDPDATQPVSAVDVDTAQYTLNATPDEGWTVDQVFCPACGSADVEIFCTAEPVVFACNECEKVFAPSLADEE